MKQDVVTQSFKEIVSALADKGINPPTVARMIEMKDGRMKGIYWKTTKAKEPELKALGDKFPEYQKLITEKTGITFERKEENIPSRELIDELRGQIGSLGKQIEKQDELIEYLKSNLNEEKAINKDLIKKMLDRQ